MKRITWWPQAFLGLTFNFGALMGYSAITGNLTFAPVLLYIGGIFWTLGYDTIYAHQDKEDDAMIGVKSTALKFGARSKQAVTLFYALHMVFTLAAIGPGHALFLIPAALHLVWQIKTWQMDNVQSCLKIFKSNQITGLLTMLAILLA